MADIEAGLQPGEGLYIDSSPGRRDAVRPQRELESIAIADNRCVDDFEVVRPGLRHRDERETVLVGYEGSPVEGKLDAGSRRRRLNHDRNMTRRGSRCRRRDDDRQRGNDKAHPDGHMTLQVTSNHLPNFGLMMPSKQGGQPATWLQELAITSR